MGGTGNFALNKRIGDFSFSLPYNFVVGVLDSAPFFWQFVVENARLVRLRGFIRWLKIQ